MKKKNNRMVDYSKYEHIPCGLFDRLKLLMEDCKFTPKSLEKFVDQIIKINNLKKKKIKFTVYVVPEGIARPRYSKRTKSFYVPNAKKFSKFFKNIINDIINLENFNLMVSACYLTMDVYLPTPNAMSKVDKVLAEKGKIRPLTKPDWDNLGKMTDMFNELLWLDDANVVEAKVSKYYSIKPRIEFKIEYLEDFDSNFNRRKIEQSKRFKFLKK